MILNGKALEDFKYKYNMSDFNEYSEVLQNALIIEFFDSVGIYIEIHYSKRLGDKFFCIINESINYNLTSYQDSRYQATKQAIKKANEIYNERFK